jgi:hypothetical protein
MNYLKLKEIEITVKELNNVFKFISEKIKKS